jgi:hypothetical protein
MNWISVKDQPPPLDTPMLVTDGEHILCCYFHLWRNMKVLECIAHNVNGYEHLPFMQHGSFEWPEETTHWMPLPELPSQS